MAHLGEEERTRRRHVDGIADLPAWTALALPLRGMPMPIYLFMSANAASSFVSASFVSRR
jgi:hypothetical protein